MDSSALFRAFREEVADYEDPPLWTDDEVWAFIRDAHRMFFRLTGGIPDLGDDDAAWATIEMVAGEPFARFHPSILRIVSAHTRRRQHPLCIINSQDLVKTFHAGYRLDDKVGQVDFMVLGFRVEQVRWIDIPVHSDIVDLEVFRMPLNVVTGPDQPLHELDEDHHRPLLHWMKHLAYLKEDADAFDQAASDRGKALFEAYCAQVRAEKERRRWKPRIVHYGGL